MESMVAMIQVLAFLIFQTLHRRVVSRDHRTGVRGWWRAWGAWRAWWWAGCWGVEQEVGLNLEVAVISVALRMEDIQFVQGSDLQYNILSTIHSCVVSRTAEV